MLKYVVSKFSSALYQRVHPDHPWLVPATVSFLESYLLPGDAGIEFGSGRSTLWFAQRVNKLVSIEHDPAWFNSVSSQIDAHQYKNVDYRLKEPNGIGGIRWKEYLAVIDEFPAEYFDFALIDGKVRHKCAIKIVDKLKPGGLMIVDNSDRYIPMRRVGLTRHQISEPINEGWRHVLNECSSWRRVDMGNGVWGTTLYFKP